MYIVDFKSMKKIFSLVTYVPLRQRLVCQNVASSAAFLWAKNAQRIAGFCGKFRAKFATF